jgi:hypothetical protein
VRKLLLSCAVVLAAILAPTAATYGPAVIENTSSQTGSVPDLPVLRNGNIIPPAATDAAVHPTTTTGAGSPTLQAPAPVHIAPAVGGGSATTAVTQGSTTTPEPATCTGVSMSKSSSENGERARTHHSNSDCGESCDNDPCDE